MAIDADRAIPPELAEVVEYRHPGVLELMPALTDALTEFTGESQYVFTGDEGGAVVVRAWHVDGKWESVGCGPLAAFRREPYAEHVLGDLREALTRSAVAGTADDTTIAAIGEICLIELAGYTYINRSQLSASAAAIDAIIVDLQEGARADLAYLSELRAVHANEIIRRCANPRPVGAQGRAAKSCT